MKSVAAGWEPGFGFVLPSVKWVQVGAPPRAAGKFKRGSARRALCGDPATFLELGRDSRDPQRRG